MLAINLETAIQYIDEQENALTNTKTWSLEDWEIYLQTLELQSPKEELYVGTANDLEKYLSRKDRNKFRFSE